MKLTILWPALALVAGIAYLSVINAEAQAPTPIPSMWLQSGSPGTTQAGNGHIDGVFIAGSFSGSGSSLTGLGGDLSGTLGAASVIRLQGRPMSAAVPGAGQVLKWSGADWAPAADTDTIYAAGPGLTLVAGTFAFDQTYGDARYINEAQAAGGALAGTYPNPTMNFTGAVANEALTYDGVSASWRFPYASGLVLPISATYAGGADAFALTVTGGSLDCGSFIISNAASSAEAVEGQSNGTGDAVFGYMTGTGTAGLFVVFNAANGNEALTGRSSGTGISVYGHTTGTGRAGVFEITNAANSNEALSGITNGTGNAGYFQQTNASAGVAAVQVTKAAAGYAINAENTEVGGSGGCLRLWNESDGAYTLFASSESTSGTRYAIYGATDSTSGRGVYGDANSITAGFAPYGVFGLCSPLTSGYGVYASGDMGASGVKPFRIDHPFDPTNKYLLHYANESPEPQNVYCGTIITGGNGFAWVTLPNYFEEINKDFKYQLTVIDDSDDFVFAKVTKEITNNAFQIRTSKPGIKVSWEVKGTRNDAYCRFKQPKDEMPKTGPEKGTYQHPELFGAPKEMGMDWHPEDGKQKKR